MSILTADALRAAARDSVAIKPAPQSGHRPADPLRELIPGEWWAAPGVRALVQSVTKRHVESITTAAPACRAALRRWAILNKEEA